MFPDLPGTNAGSMWRDCDRADRAEWDFFQSLAYGKHLSEEEATFVRLMYLTKLNKVSIPSTYVRMLCYMTNMGCGQVAR